MLKLHKILLLASIIVTFMFNSTVWAAQWARIKVDKAIIYADPLMTSAIGFVKKDKKVRVGSKLKNSQQVLSIIINEKVAYINVNDLYTENQLKEIETVNKRIKKIKSQTRIQKFISLRGGVFSSTIDYKDNDKELNTYSQNFLHYGLAGHFLDHQLKTASCFSFDYYQGKKDDEELDIAVLDFGKLSSLLYSYNQQLYYFWSISLSPFSQYRFTDVVQVNGYGIGARLGVEYLLKITQSLLISIEGSYSYLQLGGFTIDDNTVLPDTLAPSLSGPYAAFTLGYQF